MSVQNEKDRKEREKLRRKNAKQFRAFIEDQRRKKLRRLRDITDTEWQDAEKLDGETNDGGP